MSTSNTSPLNYGAILDALDGLSNDVKPETEHLAKLIRQFGRQIGHWGKPARCPTLAFAVFDEHGKGADDRVNDYGYHCFEQGVWASRASPPSQPIASDAAFEVWANHNLGEHVAIFTMADVETYVKRKCRAAWLARPATVAPDGLSRQSPVEADTQRSTRDTGPPKNCELCHGEGFMFNALCTPESCGYYADHVAGETK